MSNQMSIAKYQILSQQGGKGKYGGIYIGMSPEGRKVSIKCVTHYSSVLEVLMRKLMTIDNPHVAKVIDVFTQEDGCLYIVREYVEGIDMKSLFTNKSIYRKVEERKFVQMGISLLDALEEIHALGVIHRDIKPSNIILRCSEGQRPEDMDFRDVVLIDFEQCSAYPDESGVKSSFALIYSPPEMLLKYNTLVSPSSDLYSLSITIYHLIMGKTPYTDCNPEILVNLMLTYPMKQPPRMADDLYNILSRAAYKEPFRLPPRRLSPAEIERTLRLGVEGRYATAAQMRYDLEHVGEPFKKLSWIKNLIS